MGDLAYTSLERKELCGVNDVIGLPGGALIPAKG